MDPQPADPASAEAAATLNEATVPDAIDPAQVRAKMAAGLTKDQAVEACIAQLEHDKALAKASKGKK